MLIVSSLSGAADAFTRHRPARVVSLLSEEDTLPSFPGLAGDRHLKLYVVRESCAASIDEAARARARDLIDFVKAWDGAGDILIHCNRGVSRSTAAAFVVLCMLEPHSSEAALMKRLRAAAPHADPCPLLVTYADDILGREGRMAETVDDLSPPCAAMPAPVVTVKVTA